MWLFYRSHAKTTVRLQNLVLITITYEGPDDEEELKTVPVINNINNNYNGVIDSESNHDNEGNLFVEDFDMEVKAAPETTINTKVVCAIKNFKLHIIIMSTHNKIFNLMINLAMVASITKPTVDEPQKFNKAWNHPNIESKRK